MTKYELKEEYEARARKIAEWNPDDPEGAFKRVIDYAIDCGLCDLEDSDGASAQWWRHRVYGSPYGPYSNAIRARLDESFSAEGGWLAYLRSELRRMGARIDLSGAFEELKQLEMTEQGSA